MLFTALIPSDRLIRPMAKLIPVDCSFHFQELIRVNKVQGGGGYLRRTPDLTNEDAAREAE